MKNAIEHLMIEAHTHMSQKDYVIAMALYNEVLRLEPRNMLAKRKLDEINLKLIKFNSLQEIIEAYEKFYKATDYKNAITVLNLALTQYPNESDLWHLKLGKSYRKYHEFDKALEHYNLIPVKSNYYKFSLLGEAAIYSDKKDYGKCLSILEKYSKNFGVDDYYWNVFNRCTWEMGHHN